MTKQREENAPRVDLAVGAGDGALQDLTPVDGDDVVRVEHGLLPVGVGVAGAGGEAHGGESEVNVEVGDEGVNGVGPPGVEPEVGRERGVGGLHLHHVEGLSKAQKNRSDNHK